MGVTRAALLMAGGLLLAACTASQASVPTVTPTATRTPTPSATPTATPTDAPTATSTGTPTPRPAPTPLLSEVAPAVQPPAALPTATPVLGGTFPPLPEGTTVVWGGCASDGECHWYNFYWAPTHEVVMQHGEPQHKVQHEQCHAHQHWSINGGAPLAPSDYDLESWYGTAEGQSFTAAVAGLDWPWSHSAVNGLEDFAWTCAYWYLDPAYLLAMSPERYHWAAGHLP